MKMIISTIASESNALAVQATTARAPSPANNQLRMPEKKDVTGIFLIGALGHRRRIMLLGRRRLDLGLRILVSNLRCPMRGLAVGLCNCGCLHGCGCLRGCGCLLSLRNFLLYCLELLQLCLENARKVV